MSLMLSLRRVAVPALVGCLLLLSAPALPASAAATAATWGGVGPTAHREYGHQIPSGDRLSANNYVISDNVMYVLFMQSDGNLKLYGNGAVMWTTNTTNTRGGNNFLEMETHGNLVLKTWDGTPLWQTHTSGNGSNAVLQDDGNFVVYNTNGQAMWNSRTFGHPSYSHFVANHGTALSSNPVANQKLLPGSYLRSDDDRYALLFQLDSNVVLYGPGYHVLWNWGTYGSGANQLVMQSDGNLVLYRYNGTAAASTGTFGRGPSAAVVQDDGNFVIYKWPASRASWDPTQPTWSTGTFGRI